jgi:hypothetical protein
MDEHVEDTLLDEIVREAIARDESLKAHRAQGTRDQATLETLEILTELPSEDLETLIKTVRSRYENREHSTRFIGKHADTYLARFERFTNHGSDTFAFTWHWPAFLVPVLQIQ